MEVDAGNRSGSLNKEITAIKRLIIFGGTAFNAPVLFLFLFVLLVLNAQLAFAADPVQYLGNTIKKSESTVKGGESSVKKKPEPKPEDVLIVQLKKGADRDEFDSLLKEVNGTLINTLSMGSEIEFLIVASEPGTADATLKKMNASKEVSMVERNRMFKPLQSFSAPNDNLFSSQWDLSFMNYGQARATGLGSGSPLIFYVIDTGLQPVGFELAQVAQQYDFSNPVTPTRHQEKLHDVFGHGTAVSTVAANSNNLLGYAGQTNFGDNFFDSGRTAIVMCRISADISGTASTVSIISACQFCWGQMANQRMPVGPVNLSFGSSSGPSLNADPSIQQVAQGLRNVGSVLVLSSGNNGLVDPSPELAARRVGAISQDGLLASFSTTGPFVTAAPGVQVPVYIPYSYILPFFADGTSFASPRWCGAILACMGAMSNKSASVADQIVFDTATVTSEGQRVPNMFAAITEAARH
jgi:hypothetical protein